MDPADRSRSKRGGGRPRGRFLAGPSGTCPLRSVAQLRRLDAPNRHELGARPDRRRAPTVASHQDNEPSRPVSAAPEEIRESVQTALVRLPPKLRAVAVLALLEEHTHAEIAEMLDVPIGTVKSRVFRATRALRKELKRLGVDV